LTNRLQALQEKIVQSITPRKLRFFKESLTGYLFVAPALILIFMFGIFPVGFALYVSLHKWRILRTDFVGLNNYVRAIGNISYVVAFFLALAALLGAVLILKGIIQQAQENNQRPWLLSLPAGLHTLTIYAFLRYIWYQLPEFLDIAGKLRGAEKTRELFIQLLRGAFYAPEVYSSWRFFTLALAGSIAAAIIALIFYRKPLRSQFQTQITLMWIALGSGIGLFLFTYQQVFNAYLLALETNSDPGIWPQVIVVSAGIILLGLGWYVYFPGWRLDTGWRNSRPHGYR
jgi:ABC-type sugar transport system permease subunit